MSPEVQEKALEYKNKLIEQGYHERRATNMSAAIALQWADGGKKYESGSHGPAQHVMFEDGSWVVLSEGDVEPLASFNDVEDALRRAHEIATEHSSAVYVHDGDGNLIDKIESYRTFKGKCYHVIPYEDGWAVTRLGPNCRYETFPLKREAIDRGRELARKDASRLVIHYQSGDVARTHSYS